MVVHISKEMSQEDIQKALAKLKRSKLPIKTANEKVISKVAGAFTPAVSPMDMQKQMREEWD